MIPSISVYADSIENSKDSIQKIKQFFKDQLTDFLVFTDDIVSDISEAVLPTFYMRFYNGIVVFLSVESFLHHKDLLNNAKPILMMDQNNPIDSSIDIDRSLLKGYSILVYDKTNNNMEIIEYNEI